VPEGREPRSFGDRKPSRSFGGRPAEGRPPREPRPPQEPRLGPDGQPLPPRPRRERKPIGPDATGLGPDGKPWDPERRAKRQAERQVPMNDAVGAPVEAQSPPGPSDSSEAPKE